MFLRRCFGNRLHFCFYSLLVTRWQGTGQPTAMPIEIIIATIFFTLAFILYSVAIWRGRQAASLTLWRVIVFFLGLSADAFGVWVTVDFIGAIVLTPHAIFGFSALLLMSLHFLWVLFMFVANRQQTLGARRFGIFVWSVWMLSYLSGFVTGLQKLF